MKHLALADRLKAMVLAWLGVITWTVAGMAAQDGAPVRPPDWWEAQREINTRLQKPGTDISGLVRDIASSKAADPQSALVKLAVLMRAGMNKGAVETLQELKGLCPELGGYQVNSIYYEAADHLQAWDVAKALIETFPTNITELEVINRLIRHWLESGWSVDKVDAWLASLPPGKDALWVKQRLRFNREHGRGEDLEREWADKVRRNPQAITGALAFLDGLLFARTGPRKYDLSWMTEVLKPTRATEVQELAARLQNLEDWPSAIVFYRKAISTPLTGEEIGKMGMIRQVILPGEILAAGFQASIREGLAKCLLASGENAEAQKWMVEAQDIREKHKLGRNAALAGQVQAKSTARTVEERIKAEEKLSEDDPKYWSERARYYEGRNEPGPQEEALKKGLALTVPKQRPERGLKGYMDWRSALLQQYAKFLERQKRNAEGAALLLKEIKEAPADADSADRAVRVLWFDFKPFIRVDDERLWTWLSNRPKWDYNEERLLWEMLQTAKHQDLDKYFSRAEGMVRDQDPTRSHSLGWVMNRMNHAQRSIPVLKSAVERATDKELKEKASLTLLESYLDAGDWKQAEEVMLVASQRLTSYEVPEWYGKLALVAAQQGARKDALRIWARAAEANPAILRNLERLGKLGLRNELVEFYREMRKKMPDSEIPRKALALLGSGE